MLSYEKIYLNKHECLMRNGLYEIEEFEAFREQIKSYFMKRYSIDYMSINTVNKDKNLIFFRMDNDKWHETINKHKWGLDTFPFFLEKLEVIQPNEIYLQYFESDTYSEQDKIIDVRAEVFGVRKYGGCDIIMSTGKNDIVIYSITFKDDRSFGELLRNVLYELINDLIRYREFFTPFLRYEEMGGDFTDKKMLNHHLDEFKMENKSLFTRF